MSISVVISTRNRSKSLERTLLSVKSFADEIIVVDNESSDDTTSVAKKFNAKVYSRKNNLMLNTNKNFGFSKASSNWILSLDDDEVITDELATEILTATGSKNQYEAYWIPRKNIIFGKWIRHGIWWPDRQLRLFKKGKGSFPEKHVHEYVEVSGPTGVLNEAYIHYNYDSVQQYLSKMQDIYTESEVQKYVSSGYRTSWKDAIRFPASDFLKLYFAENGYKDGLHGLVLAGLQAFYSFLIFVKLWEKEKFSEQDPNLKEITSEFKRIRDEEKYWELSSQLKLSKSPIRSIWLKLIRRIYR